MGEFGLHLILGAAQHILDVPLSQRLRELWKTPTKPMMDESQILSQFDRLVESGDVEYDDQQEIIQLTEGPLTVSLISLHAQYLTN